MIQANSQDNFIWIKRWHGSREDTDLLRILDEIRERWDIVSIRNTGKEKKKSYRL
jgi:hypothetical protein